MRILLSICAFMLASSAASAEATITNEEMKKVQAAIGIWGCSSGAMGREMNGSGVYEVDDATCKGGKAEVMAGAYDIKLDRDFIVTSISRNW